MWVAVALVLPTIPEEEILKFGCNLPIPSPVGDYQKEKITWLLLLLGVLLNVPCDVSNFEFLFLCKLFLKHVEYSTVLINNF
jgi:hypothetical protein